MTGLLWDLDRSSRQPCLFINEKCRPVNQKAIRWCTSSAIDQFSCRGFRWYSVNHNDDRTVPKLTSMAPAEKKLERTNCQNQSNDSHLRKQSRNDFHFFRESLNDQRKFFFSPYILLYLSRSICRTEGRVSLSASTRS